MSALMPLIVAWMYDCVQIYTSQITVIVEIMTSTQAISPISLALGSFDLKYFRPGHLVTKMKQMNGRMTLNAYMPICAMTDVESGA